MHPLPVGLLLLLFSSVCLNPLSNCFHLIAINWAKNMRSCGQHFEEQLTGVSMQWCKLSRKCRQLMTHWMGNRQQAIHLNGNANVFGFFTTNLLRVFSLNCCSSMIFPNSEFLPFDTIAGQYDRQRGIQWELDMEGVKVSLRFLVTHSSWLWMQQWQRKTLHSINQRLPLGSCSGRIIAFFDFG